MQCEAKKWADEFNKEGVPKRVDFLEAYLIQVMCHTSHVTRHTTHVTRHTSHVTRHTSHVTRHTSLQLIDRPGQPLAAVEKFTEGE
jgi:hypothetical protein